MTRDRGVAERELATRLRLAIGRLNRRLRLSTSGDIPPLQMSALNTMDKHGPLRLGELAQREAVTAPTMTRVLTALEDRGLAVRRPDDEDARSVLVSVTEAGHREMERVRAVHTAVLDARLAKLTPEQRATLRAALPALEALIED